MRLRVVLVTLTLAVLSGTVANPAEPEYVGGKKCKKCHLDQYVSWEETKMAKAFDLLAAGAAADAKEKAGLDADADYTHDEKCLPCHTTGYGKPGGFVSVEKTPKLVGVQCESCHGPGSEYLKDGRMTLDSPDYKRADLIEVGLVVPDEQTCVTCHNDKSPFADPSVPFDFKERKAKGTHEHFPLEHEH